MAERRQAGLAKGVSSLEGGADRHEASGKYHSRINPIEMHGLPAELRRIVPPLRRKAALLSVSYSAIAAGAVIRKSRPKWK